jgi:protein NirF
VTPPAISTETRSTSCGQTGLDRRAALAAALGLAAAAPFAAQAADPCPEPRATGALGLVVERAAGSLVLVDWTARAALGRIGGLGDLSHAAMAFGPSQRFAYVFGRDGGLSKVDLLAGTVAARVVQAGNSIGGAISDDGRVIAVSNYEPGGVRLFDADTLAPLAEIPTAGKALGLADLPGGRFVCAVWETGEALLIDAADPAAPRVTRIPGLGREPYDGLAVAEGRFYLAGLFGEDGLALVDLWEAAPVARRVMAGYGRGEAPLPVYKMPHLQGWAVTGARWAVPAVGRHELLWLDPASLAETGRTALHGQPIFAVARPGGREIWVNFAHPLNDAVQVVDVPSGEVTRTLTPGPGVLHMEFTPRGREIWLSVRDANSVEIRDADSGEVLAAIPADAPSGIFFTARAHRMGL